MSAPTGVLVVDKPTGWTSHDVVARVRRLAGTRQVGHAGTLDPMATGVLVLGIGRGTKLLTFLVGCDKGYAATIRLGAATVTDDAEGEVRYAASADHLTRSQVETAVLGFLGSIRQVPSAVSAIKVDGRRAYARVRSGEDVELAARSVRVERFEVLEVRVVPADATTDGASSCLDVDVVVDVSSGTYVRALARDLGEQLGVGGHLVALRRTRVGAFGVNEAHNLAELGLAGDSSGTGPVGIPVLSLSEAARRALPSRHLTAAQARAVGFGQALDSDDVHGDAVAAFDPANRLVAVLDQTQRRARTRVVFPAADS